MIRSQHSRTRLAIASTVLATVFNSAPAQSATYQWLTDSSLVGRTTGGDSFLGNANDQVATSFNTIGAASQFTDGLSGPSAFFGFFKGTFTTQGDTIFGLQDQPVFGNNVFQSFNLTGQWNKPFFNLVNQPYTQSLAVTASTCSASNCLVLSHDQSFTDVFVVHDSAFNADIKVTGTGHYLLNGQDPSTLFSGDLLTHFNFVTPTLPLNWTGVAQDSEMWTVLNGQFAGFHGFTSATFFATDPISGSAADSPVILGAPWVTTGYASRNGGVAQIGSPLGGPGNDGTASLNGGNTATLDSVNLGDRTGAGAMTIQGAGTSLMVTGRSTIGDKGQLNVIAGAKLASNLAILGTGLSRIHFGGGADVQITGSAVGLATQGTAVIDGGARVTIDGGNSINSAVNLTRFAITDVGSMTVDGPGTILKIQGGTAPGGSTGVTIEGGAMVQVTNGAKIQVIKNPGQALNGIELSAGLSTLNATSQLIVDGTGSVVDAGALLSLSNQFFTLADSGLPSQLIVRNGGLAMADKILIGINGTVKGNGGTLQGAVENHGIISPGESPGTLNIQGDLTQGSDGKLIIELAGNKPGTLYDVLNVSGKLMLGGTLEVDLLNGFVPGASDTFNFLTFGSVAGAFNNFILPTFGNGETLHLHFGPNGVVLSASPVPLPAATWLFLSALGGLGLTRRRLAET